MPHSLFISDLHLCAERPQVVARFLRFLEQEASRAEALYILGDLFEYWAGDDDLDAPLHQQICQTLHALGTQGCRLYLMRGNRDFLMGAALAAACGATLLNDPTRIELYGRPTLLSHGDALCTDDTAYQEFRTMVRNPRWQQQFLAQPLALRKQLIEQMREKSEGEKQRKESYIMDVNVQAVNALLREHGYPDLIHGHTHRPAHHLIHLDDHSCHRWVLGEWDGGSTQILRADAAGLRYQTLD